MEELTALLISLENALNDKAPEVAQSLQPGLTRAEIDGLTAKFSWVLPEDVYQLYQWHNGLSRQASKMNLIEKLLRQKDKWHGELSGRENELHLNYGQHLITAKFLPLDYALAGHRHLKLGKCLLDLLPVFIVSDRNNKLYCMIRLDAEQSTVYCANGAKVPPLGITEAFLSTQVQYRSLIDFVSFLTACCQQVVDFTSESQEEATDYKLNPEQFEQIYQQYKS